MHKFSREQKKFIQILAAVQPAPSFSMDSSIQQPIPMEEHANKVPVK
jgi:hypothetical protein